MIISGIGIGCRNFMQCLLSTAGIAPYSYFKHKGWLRRDGVSVLLTISRSIKPGGIIMTLKPAILLLWHGSETVSTARSLLEKKQSVNLQLAANYHHAFINHLNLETSQKQSEDIEIEGGPELLSRIAEIRGLEEFSDLVQLAHQANASVRVENPALVIISIPD